MATKFVCSVCGYVHEGNDLPELCPVCSQPKDVFEKESKTVNRDSNSYTFIYASALVVLVAALLAVAAVGLKPFQDKNVSIAKKTDILKSVGIASTAADAEELYETYVKETYIINAAGEQVSGKAFDVDLAVEVKKAVADRQLPVYVCTLQDGATKYILPVRGKGLWGPVWGYIAVNDDKNTIYGATFGHKGETPGLGAEIEKEAFQVQFQDKKILKDGKITFAVAKGGAKPGDDYAVDAISGGTITSKGVEAMLLECLTAYSAFLSDVAPAEVVNVEIATDSIAAEVVGNDSIK